MSETVQEMVGNSWDILNTILGHKYLQNHSNRVEANIYNKSDFDSTLYTINCFADVSTQEACMVTQKLNLDQIHVWKELHTYTEGHEY